MKPGGRDYFPTYFISQHCPNFRKLHYDKWKLHTNISHEHRYQNSKQKDIWKTFVTLATLKCFEKKKSNSSYLTPTSLGKGSIIATLYSCKERSIWWLLLQLPKDCKCSLRLCLLPSGTRDGDRRWSCSCKWYREGTCPVKLFPAPSFICFI